MEKEDLKKVIEWLVSDDTGMSSISIVIHMLDIRSTKNSYPHDVWDRGRCVRLLKIFPQWHKRLDEMSVYTGWADQVELIKKEFND